MEITRITLDDYQQFWPTFKAIAAAQDSYAFAPDISYDEAFEAWCLEPQVTYVTRHNGKIAGSYYLKPNAAGPASHICNCGYMVAADFQGQGIARALCNHSQEIAMDLGFKAMQFNSVLATNAAAIHLWKSLGFSIIGTIPDAYNHKQSGFVDAFIMYKSLIPQ